MTDGSFNLKVIPILQQRNLKVVTQVDQWPRALRRASVNSFGYGGEIMLPYTSIQNNMLTVTRGECARYP